MRYIKVNINDIEFEYKEYEQSLYQSVERIGFSFPISVNIIDNKYICIDGHKRLSVLKDILMNNPDYKRGSEVVVLVKNNENSRSQDCWRGRNTH